MIKANVGVSNRDMRIHAKFRSYDASHSDERNLLLNTNIPIPNAVVTVVCLIYAKDTPVQDFRTNEGEIERLLAIYQEQWAKAARREAVQPRNADVSNRDIEDTCEISEL